MSDIIQSTASARAKDEEARDATEELHAVKVSEIIKTLMLTRVAYGSGRASPWGEDILYKIKFAESITLRNVHIHERTGVNFNTGDFVIGIREEDERSYHEFTVRVGEYELDEDVNIAIRAGKWLYVTLNDTWPDDGSSNYPEFFINLHFQKRRR